MAFLVLESGLAQNIEGGAHLGISALGDQEFVEETALEREAGIWVLLWPATNIALAGDWTYVPQDDFQFFRGPFLVGERDRNRQYFDMTLQYYFYNRESTRFFVQFGGGWLWDNREVINLQGVPDFEEHGPETSLHSMWTLGAGARKRLVPHLHWITEVKLHNPGRDHRDGFRALTGLTVSWR